MSTDEDGKGHTCPTTTMIIYDDMALVGKELLSAIAASSVTPTQIDWSKVTLSCGPIDPPAQYPCPECRKELGHPSVRIHTECLILKLEKRVSDLESQVNTMTVVLAQLTRS